MNRIPERPDPLERDVAAFLGEVGCKTPEVLLDRLRADHSRETTPYHSWRHILHGLGLIWEFRCAIPEFEAVVVAWLNHDRIYDPRGTENEEKSAELGRQMCLELGRPDLAERVHALILDTRHQSEPDTPAGRWIVGIDLAILGETPDRYDQFEHNISQEYAHVPRVLYRVGRGRILRGFLERDRIYDVPVLHERFECQARDNLQKAIDAL